MAKYNVHAGHNPDGKIACGAVGLIKESTEARKVKDELIKLMKSAGNTVYDCTVSNGKSQSDVLNKIVAKCNKHKVNYDISIHFNSGASDKKGNGKTTGVEVLLYDDSNKAQITAAKNICKEFEKLGFKNRGVKYRGDSLAVLRDTKSLAILIEVCFVDDADDVKLYKKVGAKGIAEAICRGLGIKLAKKKTVTEIAKEVMAGKFGNGHATRKKKIEALGYNYEEVRKKVNELSKK